MDSQYADWLNTAVTLAQRAGAVILPYYQHTNTITLKGNDPRNLVTEADVAAEQTIVGLLRAHYPDHRIVGEEGTGHGELIDPEIPTWFIDPIDGTSNFAHGSPWFAVSIGVSYQGKVRAGVIYAPKLEWLFTAVEGGGVFLNGEPLRVTERKELISVIVSMEWSRDPVLRQATSTTATTLLNDIHTLRTFGSAALALAAVAAGWIDAYMNYALSAWDIAAGALMVEEAGGHVTHLDNAPFTLSVGNILASNGKIHDNLLGYVVRS